VSRADHPAERIREAQAISRAADAWTRTEELAADATLARIRRDRAVRLAVTIIALPAAFLLFAAALHEAVELWHGVRP